MSQEKGNSKVNENAIEGRNPVIEAIRAGKEIDRLYVLDGCKDGAILTIKREAAKKDIAIKYADKDRLDHIVIAIHHLPAVPVKAVKRAGTDHRFDRTLVQAAVVAPFQKVLQAAEWAVRLTLRDPCIR